MVRKSRLAVILIVVTGALTIVGGGAYIISQNPVVTRLLGLTRQSTKALLTLETSHPELPMTIAPESDLYAEFIGANEGLLNERGVEQVRVEITDRPAEKMLFNRWDVSNEANTTEFVEYGGVVYAKDRDLLIVTVYVDFPATRSRGWNYLSYENYVTDRVVFALLSFIRHGSRNDLTQAELSGLNRATAFRLGSKAKDNNLFLIRSP